MFDWLDAALGESSQVITASRRLARELRDEYSRHMLATGRQAWRSPVILYWQDWLTERLADSTAAAGLPIRITAQQSRVLWERCLRREVADPLLNIGMLARQALETWHSLCEWRLSLAECQRAARNHDQRMFAKAAANYQSILARENWIDDAGLAGLAVQEISAGRIRLGGKLTLAGFDRLTPLQQSLKVAIEQAGRTVSLAPADAIAAELMLHTAESRDAELRAAGAWARQQVLRSPGGRVAIVVTHLEQDARRCLRLVKEGLIPGWQTAAPEENALVNISYGQKLVEHPAISIAILALRWLHSDLSTMEVSRLLQTNLLGSAQNDDLTRLELHLRKRPEQSWSPAVLLAEIASSQRAGAAPFAVNRIRCIAEWRKQLLPRQSPASWVELFAAVLRELHWPGPEVLDSGEFQLVNRWRELLNDVARLQLVSPSMTAAETLARITSIASELVFQPESDRAIVQVMGPLEAAGLHFDALWVSGVSNRNWPPPGRPLSLLSRDLQRDAGMPDASPDDTLAYAERVLARLVSSATRVVLSYPATQDDVQQSASELLQGLAKAETPATPDPGWHARQQCSAAGATCMALDRVPAIGAEEIVAGGAATIQRQLQDPFAAFVTGRLGVRTLWPIVAGLPASLRGSLIHAALHRLYAQCPAGEQIRSWDDSEIASRCKLAVQSAFRSQERRADVVLRILLQLEKTRVNALLAGVVALDANRDDFKIHCVEQKFAAALRVSSCDCALTALISTAMVRYESSTTKPALPGSCWIATRILRTCNCLSTRSP